MSEAIYQLANHIVGGILWGDVDKQIFDASRNKCRVVVGFDEGAVARLRRVLRLLGLANAVPEDDVELMGSLFSVLGTIASSIERKLPQAAADEPETSNAARNDPPLSDDPVELHAEIFRLRAQLEGPTGHKTWKDAAISERQLRVEAENKLKALPNLAAGPEAAGVIEVDDVFGWHMRPLKPWTDIGKDTVLYKLP